MFYCGCVLKLALVFYCYQKCRFELVSKETFYISMPTQVSKKENVCRFRFEAQASDGKYDSLVRIEISVIVS